VKGHGPVQIRMCSAENPAVTDLAVPHGTNQKPTDMKKVLRTLAGMACIASIILAGCEEPDGSCNLAWTLSFLALAFATGFYLNKSNTKNTSR